MIVGVPREIKPGEQRVALTPAGARELSEAGHGVVVERGAGLGSGIGDDEYTAAGAALDTVERVWASADLILKVKEPIAAEYEHFAPDRRSSPTSTWPPPPSWPGSSCARASSPLPTRRWSAPIAASPC